MCICHIPWYSIYLLKFAFGTGLLLSLSDFRIHLNNPAAPHDYLLNLFVRGGWLVYSLLLDKRGYLKIVDFGFAKKLKKNEWTYTLCGTPDYLVSVCG